jgi:citrate lyase synthetase
LKNWVGTILLRDSARRLPFKRPLLRLVSEKVPLLEGLVHQEDLRLQSEFEYFMEAMSTNDKAELVKQGSSESSTTKTLAAVLLKESNEGDSTVINTPITSNLTKVAEDAKVMTYAG